MTHPAELPDTYASLSPEARLVARAFGVVYPNSAAPASMAKVNRTADIRIRGRFVTIKKTKAAIEELLKAGILRITKTHGLTAAPRWAPWLAVQAARKAQLDRIEEAYRGVYPTWSMSEKDEIMRFRCAVIARRFDEIGSGYGKIEPQDWRWLTYPGADQVLATLPDRYVDDALADCFDEMIETAAAPGQLEAACFELAPDPSVHIADIAFIRILQGRLGEAVEVFDKLPSEVRNGKRARVGKAATLGLIATLCGEDAEAVRFMNEAIAEEKAGTRKRNIFPDSRAFALSLLSLVREDSPPNAAMLEHLLRVGDKLDIQLALVRLVALASDIRNGAAWGLANLYTELERVDSIVRLFDGWICCWMDDYQDFESPARVKALTKFANRALANDYDWLVAECLEILNRIGFSPSGGFSPSDESSPSDGPAPSETGTAQANADKPPESWPEANGPNPEDWARAAKVHERLGTTTLAQLVTPVESWEYSLKEIERLAYDTGKKPKPRKKKAAKGGQRRLVWILTDAGRAGVSVKPKEQSANRNGTWTKGRVVAFKRLSAQAATMGFLLDQDRAAAAKIVNYPRGYGSPTYSLPASGLYELAGHPYVFNTAGDSVDIVRREPELQIDDKGKALVVQIAPHILEASGPAYDINMATPTRCEVTRFTAEHKRLFDIIPVSGLTLPAGSKQRLLKAVSGLAGEVRVQGAIGAGVSVAPQVEADCVPWVRLEPKGEGLMVDLVVEPVPKSGTYFPPGE